MKKKKHLTHHPKDDMHAKQPKFLLPESCQQLMNLKNQCCEPFKIPCSVDAFRPIRDDFPYRP